MRSQPLRARRPARAQRAKAGTEAAAAGGDNRPARPLQDASDLPSEGAEAPAAFAEPRIGGDETIETDVAPDRLDVESSLRRTASTEACGIADEHDEEPPDLP